MQVKRIFTALFHLIFNRYVFILLLLAIIAGAGLILYAGHTITAASQGRLYHSLDDLPVRKVALVLGAKPGNRYFNRRIDAAAELYQAGKVTWLLVSGDNGNAHYDEPSAMRKALIARGVPSDAIYCDYAGFSTLDSVVRTQKVFGENRFTIVSQAFHNQRAIWLAQQYGIDAIGFNAEDLSGKHGRYTQIREKLARVSAVLDARILHRQPKYLGPLVTLRANGKSGCPVQ
ncbi:SanA/YdcF family protein [Klebsiella sp. RIT-PI-d]|uniref:SanA/YdcF family protein n=1 Tax=Klebsiella sp. RIT-PI-d TaxID=1681196 RepID=UPI0006765236|nr:ElyC/SanA/YdcF family protein [Klebsiella sp. RIT-PI-d]